MKCIAFSIALLRVATSSSAYDIATHALISNRAVQRSIIDSDPTFTSRLGLSGWVADLPPSPFRTPIGDYYFDVGTSVQARSATYYELKTMDAINEKPASLQICCCCV